MPFCSQCGNQVGTGDQYCGRCGAPQPGGAPPPPPRGAPRYRAQGRDPLTNIDARTASILCYIPGIGWIMSIIVNIGMWLERFVIVVTSLHRDFLPSSWGMYSPTIWDWGTFVGTIGLFLALLFLFLRFLPMISIAEMRTMVPEARVDEDLRVI